MRKKLIFKFFGACLVAAMISVTANAQTGSSYTTAAGMRVEFGDGGTGFGFNGKHFLTENNAIDASLIFFDGGVVGLGGEFQYNAPINNANGLQYYAGLGPNFLFGKGSTAIQLRPVLGLDYKIDTAPIGFAFDWRPMFTLNNGTDFNAGRFGLSVRYVIK